MGEHNDSSLQGPHLDMLSVVGHDLVEIRAILNDPNATVDQLRHAAIRLMSDHDKFRFRATGWAYRVECAEEQLRRIRVIIDEGGYHG